MTEATRIYRVDTRYGQDRVCYFEEGKPDWCHYVGHTVGGKSEGPDKPGFREATADEIAAFEAEEQKREARQAAEHAREAELLALAGLKHDDFVRFRSVYRYGDTLSVRTRENGVDAISVEAIRNPNYRNRENDEGDSTYAHYEFAIPAAREKGGDA